MSQTRILVGLNPDASPSNEGAASSVNRAAAVHPVHKPTMTNADVFWRVIASSAGIADSIGLAVIFIFKQLLLALLVTNPLWSRLLFPPTAFFASVIAGVEVRHVYREWQKGNKSALPIINAVVGVLMAFAIIFAVAGSLAAPLKFGPAAPYFFTVAVGLKALYHFAVAGYALVKLQPHQDAIASKREALDSHTLSSEKRANYKALLKHNLIGGALGTAVGTAIGTVMVFEHTEVAIFIGVPVAALAVCAGMYNIYLIFQAKYAQEIQALRNQQSIDIERADYVFIPDLRAAQSPTPQISSEDDVKVAQVRFAPLDLKTTLAELSKTMPDVYLSQPSTGAQISAAIPAVSASAAIPVAQVSAAVPAINVSAASLAAEPLSEAALAAAAPPASPPAPHILRGVGGDNAYDSPLPPPRPQGLLGGISRFLSQPEQPAKTETTSLLRQDSDITPGYGGIN